MSGWFHQYGWGVLLGAAIALVSLWSLRRARRSRGERHHVIDVVGVFLGAAITLLSLFAWAKGWQ